MVSPSAIYVRMPNWIGDLCMSLPCLDALLQTGLPVFACARPWARSLLKATPVAGLVDMTGAWLADTCQTRRHHHANHHAGAVGLLLPDSFSSALVFRLAGIPAAGYRDDGRSLMLKWPTQKPSDALHAVESWFSLTQQTLLRWQLIDETTRPPARLPLSLDASHEHQAQQALDQAAIESGSFVLIAPTAVGHHQGKHKVWPHFDALTQELQAMGQTVVMCPPPAERAQALANAPGALCLPAMDLGAFAALTRMARVVVCNDSGVSHLAAAAGARQLTLFGVTDASHTGPWSPDALCLGGMNHWPTLPEVLQALEPFLSDAGSRQGSA